ncbi:MAG: FAD-binding domain-containing protein [Pseudomonadota bacterium]
MLFTPTRSAGLARLAQFLPNAGKAYEATRNFDDAVQDDGLRANVSQLSPWLHAGLISETEVIDFVLGSHSMRTADKFIAEVFWRIYFKGYLEQRPSIWHSYCRDRDAAHRRMAGNTGLQTAYTEATQGRTGIAAFDHWARELVETGYLHNHARMWFTSIWIFTLKLDWQLGADFFLRHLVDGDAASNTLSWRWVGGLHTKGKTYLARPDNIERYTANQPTGPLIAQGLANEATPLEEATEHKRTAINFPGEFEPPAKFALLLHDEAAHHGAIDLPSEPKLVIGAARPEARSPEPIGNAACKFALEAVAHGVAEAGEAFQCPTANWAEDASIRDILTQAEITHIVTPYLPTSWTRDALIGELSTYNEKGHLQFLVSNVNRATWPFAKAGFFGVKKKIEPILAELGISGRAPASF